MNDAPAQPVCQPVVHSPSLSAAVDAFLHEVRDWADDCIAEYADAPATDVHDQHTYTIGWAPMIRALDHREAVDFMRTGRDRIRDHFVNTGAWKHGYWRKQEIHHGTEHFELFVQTLWRLDPGDDDTVAHFIDAVEHFGNWADDDGVPDWFDHDNGLFCSLYLGTDEVDASEASRLNVADHFRGVNLLLVAHEMTGDPRYLQAAAKHGKLWADAINRFGEAPHGLSRDGALRGVDDESYARYRRFAGQAGDLSVKVDRAENILASDGIAALLALWNRTGDDAFRDAARTLVEQLSTELADPDAGPAADAVRYYRRVTGDTCFDDAVRSAVADADPLAIRAIAVDVDARRPERGHGVGKRVDAPIWLEHDRPRTVSPITLAVAAEIEGDTAKQAAAVDLARAYFGLARKVFPHGRHHGCSARSVSAVARGHGRDNNAGMVTAVLKPALAGLA